MGMPINSYTVLRTLALGGELYEQEAVKNALAPFNLFAFILHDPEIHSQFHEYLARNFDRFDYTTGDKLLFFALVDTPSEWLKHAKARDYFRVLRSWEAAQMADSSSAPQSTDRSLTVTAIANALEIPIEKLPCIIITNNFQSNDFFWFSTNHHSISEQLGELGFIADRTIIKDQLTIPINDLFRQISDRLNFSSSKGYQSLSENLARNLSTILSFIVTADPNIDSYLRNLARKQAGTTIRDLYTLLQQQKIHDGEPTYQFEHIAIEIINALALLNAKSPDNLHRFLPIPKEHLEHESYLILKTAYKVYELLETEQPEDVDEVLDVLDETDDWSPGVIGLSKVFEKEVNLSVVHWLRNEKGIEMPNYFNQPKPRFQAQIGRANLNATHEDGRWRAPGIGQSEFAFRRFIEHSLPPSWDLARANFLLNHWEAIRKSRNNAAHDQLVKEDKVQRVLDSLRTLTTHNYFEHFYRLKTLYRS